MSVVSDPHERVRPWYLRDTGFRDLLTEEDRMAFMQVCPERPFPRGGTIFRAGEPAESLHVVARGQVKLVAHTASGEERILAVLGPEDFFGEAFLWEENHYRVDAVALTDAATCPMSRAQLMQLGLRAPTFVVGFLRIMATQVMACRTHLAWSNRPIRARVANIVADQVRRFGTPDGDDGWFRLETPLKHDEIASLASATRVSVTTAFGQLRTQGILEGSRGSYRAYLPGLADEAEGDEDDAGAR